MNIRLIGMITSYIVATIFLIAGMVYFLQDKFDIATYYICLAIFFKTKDML